MSKDINIHLKTRGAGQTKQQLEDVGQAAKQVGDKTAEGHKEGAGAVDKTSQKMTRMGRVLGNLKSQVMSFVGAYLGLQAVRGVVTWLITKLEKIAQLQKEIYEKSLSFMEVGQALEMQTGTVGMQQDWAQQATKLQAAGGLRGPDVAQQMMISMDVALQRQGGIKAPQVMALAMQLAPFVGAQQMGPEEVAKLFEFAETAGIAPTTEAYGKYFAKIQAGYTASKATVFGQYMVGLQKGVTPFMAAGGTLEEGIAAYSAARKVTYNEMVAAQLLEQTARLASGAYKKPREAIEQGLGVRWDELSMNERYNALLQYAGGLPGARREQILAEQGFPAEITSKIGMLVTPGALTTLAETREKVQASTTALLDKQTQAYLDSVLGKERIADAEIALKGIKVAPEFADWQTRLENAEEEVKIRAARGKVREA